MRKTLPVLEKINENSSKGSVYPKINVRNIYRYSTEYNDLYRDIVSVGEFKINN